MAGLQAERVLLLTGATGFVGGAVRPALARAGWRVRCLTRDPARARQREPSLDWVQGDVADPASCARALAGCQAALYLVHGIGEGRDYHRHEVMAAATFAKAAAVAGVERIVYLGGVAPHGAGSEHLRSRLDVGEAVRAVEVPTIELRASMIVGHGSLSWLIVRDLAARLPFMVLPRWLKSRTQPVSIDDVVVALVRALELPPAASAWFDIPGPLTLSGKQILQDTARVMGLRHPRMVELPLLSPRLSALWVRFVTRAQWSVAREVVVGLTEDLLARDDRFWQLIGHAQRSSFTEAARLALDAERGAGRVAGVWGAIERVRRPRAALAISDGATDLSSPRSRSTSLAVACAVVWLAAAASAGTLGIWSALGGAAVALGLAVLLFDRPAATALLRPSLRLTLLGAAAGGLMAIATYLLYPLLARSLPFIATDTAQLYAAVQVPSLVVALVALVPVIVGEDLVWRGVVQTSLVQRLGAWRGVALTAFVYALVHLPLGSPVLVAVAFCCGLAWGALRAATASLVPTLVAHLLWDVFVLLWLPVSTR